MPGLKSKSGALGENIMHERVIEYIKCKCSCSVLGCSSFILIVCDKFDATESESKSEYIANKLSRRVSLSESSLFANLSHLSLYLWMQNTNKCKVDKVTSNVNQNMILQVKH